MKKDVTVQERAEYRSHLRSRLEEWLTTHCHRIGGDRRSWAQTPPFPLKDRQGAWVTQDRRKCPDRRLSNIEVRWLGQLTDKGASR